MKNLLLCCCALLISLVLVQAKKEEHSKFFQDHFTNGAHNPSFDHLSILGSKKSEEEFEEMEPEESQKHLAKLIVRMDLDKDGKIVLPELQSWIFNSYKALDDEEAKEEFKTVDLDGDGHATWDEYVKKVYSYTKEDLDNIKQKSKPEREEVEKMIGDDRDKFFLADRNGDGNLNITEFPAFVHPHDYSFMHNLEIKHALKDHDKDKDGKISFKEYKIDTTEKHDVTEEMSEEVKFNEYDINKDGFLDEKEMVAWILPNTMQNAKEEAEHLINEADTDNDKVLTEKEILASYDTFVGSQATDYGRHLHLLKDEL